MKNKITYMLTALLMLVGCSKEQIADSEINNANGEETISIRIKTSKEPSGSRVNFDGNILTWKDSEDLCLVGINEADEYVGQSTFTRMNNVPGEYDYFKGAPVTNAVKYYVYLPNTNLDLSEENLRKCQGVIDINAFIDEKYKKEIKLFTVNVSESIILSAGPILKNDLESPISLQMHNGIVHFHVNSLPDIDKDGDGEKEQLPEPVQVNISSIKLIQNAGKANEKYILYCWEHKHELYKISVTTGNDFYLTFNPNGISLKQGDSLTLELEIYNDKGGVSSISATQVCSSDKVYQPGKMYTFYIAHKGVESGRPATFENWK